MIANEIPDGFRRVHSSGVKICGGSGSQSGYYLWSDFGGKVHFIAVPSGQYKEIVPVMKIYINGEFRVTKSPSSTLFPGKYIYKVTFSGLSYGDEYYIAVQYGGYEFNTGNRIYTGCMGSAPEAFEESTQINASPSSPYDKEYSMALGAITFSSDYGTLGEYSREARTRLVESCLQYTEFDAILGKVSNLTSVNLDEFDKSTGTWTRPSAFTREAQIYRFDVSEDSPAKVGIATGTSAAYYSYFSDYVDEWISDVNYLLGGAFFIRDDDIGSSEKGIRIQIGSHDDMFGYSPETGASDVKYGTWERTHWNPDTGGTVHCEVRLCNELRFAMESPSDFRNAVYEELTESLGCGNDTYRVYDSIFSEVWYVGKENNLLIGNTPTYDGEVVKMLYKELKIGETMSSLAHRLTPSQACIVKLPCVKWGNIRNKSYSIRTFSINRKVTWRTAAGDESGEIFWWWDDDVNGYSDIAESITVNPPYSTPVSAPTLVERGAMYFKIDVGDTRVYDVKVVSTDEGDEFITNNAKGQYIQISGLSPTVTYRIYSRISGSSAWFGGFPGTTCPAMPELSAEPSETAFTVTVGAPTEGRYTEFSFGVSYIKNGSEVTDYKEHVAAGSEFTYEADADTKYSAYGSTVYVINGVELWSETAISEGYTNAVGAKNPVASRIDGGLVISWDAVPGLVLYRVKLVRLYDSQTTVSDVLSYPVCTFTGLQHGVTYKVSLDTWNGGKWIGYCSEKYVTTAPAQPVIYSVLQGGGVITIEWGLAAESNVSRVYFELYSDDGLLIEEKIIYNETSGTLKFSAVEGGEYSIRVRSSFIMGSSELFSVDGDGNIYELKKDIGVTSRPSLFYWSDYTEYMSEGCAVSYTPYEAWNALIANIREMIRYTGIDGVMPTSSQLYGAAHGISFTDACTVALIDSTDKVLYANKFNIANYIISSIGEQTGLNVKNSKNIVYAADLTVLQDAINSII